MVAQRSSRRRIRDSIVVSISACHVEDPGSIPGRGALPFDEPHFIPSSLPPQITPLLLAAGAARHADSRAVGAMG